LQETIATLIWFDVGLSPHNWVTQFDGHSAGKRDCQVLLLLLLLLGARLGHSTQIRARVAGKRAEIRREKWGQKGWMRDLQNGLQTRKESENRPKRPVDKVYENDDYHTYSPISSGNIKLEINIEK